MDNRQSSLRISSLLNDVNDEKPTFNNDTNSNIMNKYSLPNILNSNENSPLLELENPAPTNGSGLVQEKSELKIETKVIHPKPVQQQNINSYLYAQPRSRSFGNQFDLNTIDKTTLVLDKETSFEQKLYHQNSQLFYTLPEGSVPTFIIDDFEGFDYKNPIEFYEAVIDLGEKYGAVKLTIRDDRFNITNNLIDKYELDNEQFWFKTRRQYLHSYDREYMKILQFHKDLYDYYKNIKKNTSAKIPNIDKRRLDLYRLWYCVQLRGGFESVCSKKLWAQIGRELGYSGRIMSSLSTSLRSAYLKVLLDFDNYRKQLQEQQIERDKSASANHIFEQQQQQQQQQDEIKHNIISETESLNRSKLEISPGKRTFAISLMAPDSIGNYNNKKSKLKNPILEEVSFITSSAVEYPRLRDVKYSKGIYTVFDKVTETKKNLAVNSDITVPGYDFTFWNNSQEIYDKSIFDSKASSVFSVKQFYEKSQRNLNKLKTTYNNTVELQSFSDPTGTITDTCFENILDNLLSDTVLDYEVDTALNIFPMINNSDYILDQLSYDNKINNADFWKLENLPLLEDSLLRNVDIDYGGLTKSKFEIGMHFSSSGWSVNDNFVPSVDFNHIGSSKFWYIIAPNDMQKFEKIIKEVNQHEPFSCFNSEKHNADDVEEKFKLSEFYKSFTETNYTNPIIFGNKRKNNHSLLKDADIKSMNLNMLPNDIYFKSKFLNEKGIRLMKVSQDTGSFLFKYPKTYSASYGTGFYISENASFAPKSWITHAFEGNQWLLERNILPSIQVAQLFSNIGINNLSLRAEIVDNLRDHIYTELNYRSRLRNICPTINEVVDKYDFISDSSLKSTGFSKVLITDTNDCITLSLDEFFLLDKNYNFSERSTDPSNELNIFLHYYHDDDILRTLSEFSSQKVFDTVNFTTPERTFDDSFQKLVNDSYCNKRIPISELKNLISQFDPKDVNRNFDVGIIDDTELLIGEAKAILLKLSTLASKEIDTDLGDNMNIKKLTVVNNDSLLERIENLKSSISSTSLYFPEMDQIDYICSNIFTVTNEAIDALNSDSLALLMEVYIMYHRIPIKFSIIKRVIQAIHRLKWLEVYDRFMLIGDSKMDYLSEEFTLTALSKFFSFGIECCINDDLPKLENLKSKILKTSDINSTLSKLFKAKKQQNKMSITKLIKIFETVAQENLPIGGHLAGVLKEIVCNVSNVKKEFEPLYNLLKINEKKKSQILKAVKNNHTIDHNLLMLFNGSKIDCRASATDVANLKLLNRQCKLAKSWTSEVSKATNKRLDKYVICTKQSLDIKDDIYNGTKQPVSEGAMNNKYCYCREGDSGGTMIECEICKDWYHKACINSGKWELPKGADVVFICAICNLNNDLDFFKSRNSLSFDTIKSLITMGINLKILPDRVFIGELFDIYSSIIGFIEYIDSHIKNETGNVKESISAKELKFLLKKVIGSKINFDDTFIAPLWNRFKELEQETFNNFEKNGLSIFTGYESAVADVTIEAKNSNNQTPILPSIKQEDSKLPTSDFDNRNNTIVTEQVDDSGDDHSTQHPPTDQKTYTIPSNDKKEHQAIFS